MKSLTFTDWIGIGKDNITFDLLKMFLDRNIAWTPQYVILVKPKKDIYDWLDSNNEICYIRSGWYWFFKDLADAARFKLIFG
jgi:hypothetical protein